MRFSKYAALILIVWSMLGGWQTSAQDDAEIPYIHYYSDLLGGLVIERADGTDSRVLEMEVDIKSNLETGTIDWSPSGAWFTAQSVAIFSADGSQRIPYPQPIIRHEFYTQWSPIDDILLVAGITYGFNIRAQLYDVSTQTLLADFTLSNPPHEFFNLTLRWSSDGHEAYVFGYHHLLTLSRDGVTDLNIQVPFPGYTPGSLFEQGRLLSKDITMYPENGPLFTIRDVETNIWRSVDDLTWSPYSIIQWNPPRDYALLYTPDCAEDTCERTLKLFNWQTGDITHVSPNIQLFQRRRDCLIKFMFDCKDIWSPGGRYAILDDADQRTLYLLDTQTGETTPLSVWGNYEWAVGDVLFLKTDSFYRYDPATNELTTLDITGDDNIPDFSPSPDGRFIGLLSDPTSVIDSATGELIIQTAPHSASTGTISYPAYGYQWHPSGVWAMADYNIFFAGGGIGRRASMVFDLAGTVRRELPVGGMAGFMPERAIPYLSPGQPRSLKTEPTYTLFQQGKVSGVSWHPTEPNQLVTYSQEAGLVFWSLEDQPHITQQVMPSHPLPYERKLFWLPESDRVGFLEGREIYVLDEETGEPVLVSAAERATVETLLYEYLAQQVVPDTYALATIDVRHGIMAGGAFHNDTILIFDAQTGQLIDEWDGTALSLAMSSDGRWLATTSNGMTSIWELPAAVTSE